MSTDQYRDLATRAAWTFVQTFIVVLAASAAGIVDLETLKAAALGAAAAGLSAVKTAVLSGGQDTAEDDR